MWHGEYLARVKTMPKLDTLLSKAKTPELKNIDQSDIMGRLKGYQAERQKVKAKSQGEG